MKLTLRSFLLCSFILLHCTCGRAQDTRLIDSLEQVLIGQDKSDTLRITTLVNLWRATSQNDLNSAKGYAERMISESKAMNYATGEATGYQRLGIIQDFLGQADSTLLNYRRALRIYEEKGWGRLQGIMLYNTAIIFNNAGVLDSTSYYLGMADSLFSLGEMPKERSAVNKLRATVERERGHFAESLDLALKARKLAEAAGDSSRMADADTEIAFGYYELEDYATAIEIFERGLDFFMRDNDYYFAAQCLINLMTAYNLNGQPEVGLVKGLQGLEFIVANKFTDLEADARRSLGSIYIDLKQPTKAIPHLEQAEKLISGEYEGAMLAEVLGLLANARLSLGDSNEARRLAREALRLSRERDQPDFEQYALQVLVQANSREGRYAKALEYQQQKETVKDSLYQKETGEKLAELTVLFEKEKQDRIISDQKSQLALLESNARADRLQRTGLLGGIIALLALIAAGWYSFRQRHKRQAIEKARLTDEVKTHQKELSAHALQMARKGQLLDQLGEELRQIKGERPDDRKKLNGMLRELSSEERIDQDWDNFRTYFQGVHGDFEERLKAVAEQSPSPRELRLAALIKMQLNNQEIGAILGVTQDSLYKAKYRLRKKLPAAEEGGLDGYLLGI
jgi:tetratricopeptide (TPR) repeat protein